MYIAFALSCGSDVTIRSYVIVFLIGTFVNCATDFNLLCRFVVASWDAGKGEIVSNNSVDISIAVATEKVSFDPIYF